MQNVLPLKAHTDSIPTQDESPKIRPMSLGVSILLFGAPAVLVALGFHWFRPLLENLGYSPIVSFLGSLTVPLALLFAATMVAYHRLEKRPLELGAFRERMRFPKFRLADLLLGVGLFIVISVGYGMFKGIAVSLIRGGLIPLPANLPALVDPLVEFTPAVLDQQAGGALAGQWDIVLLYLVAFAFNIVGEELWWRGYILPRQELTHGKWTWLVHGLLWNLFHFFKWWDLIALLPVTLLLSFAAQRLKNNWPTFIAHALLNGLSVALIIAGVLGWLG